MRARERDNEQDRERSPTDKVRFSFYAKFVSIVSYCILSLF